MTLIRSLFVFLLLAATTVAGASNNSKWQFKVTLDDKVVGSHTYLVTNNGETTLVESNAELDVKVLFITAFRYRHASDELWSADCLQKIEATTKSNGKNFQVNGLAESDQLRLKTNNGETVLDSCVQTFAYWNPAILDADYLLNPQTGEHVKINVTPLGQEPVRYKGELVEAKKYRLTNNHPDENKRVDISLWYAADTTQWLALRSVAKGGRILEYEAVDGPEISNDLRASNTVTDTATVNP